MAGGGSGFIRLRLSFDYPPPAAPGRRLCWLLVDLDSCRVVADLESLIRDRFELSRGSVLSLFVQDCYLPHTESVLLVRDNDSVRVKVDWVSQENGHGACPAATSVCPTVAGVCPTATYVKPRTGKSSSEDYPGRVARKKKKRIKRREESEGQDGEKKSPTRRPKKKKNRGGVPPPGSPTHSPTARDQQSPGTPTSEVNTGQPPSSSHQSRTELSTPPQKEPAAAPPSPSSPLQQQEEEEDIQLVIHPLKQQPHPPPPWPGERRGGCFESRRKQTVPETSPVLQNRAPHQDYSLMPLLAAPPPVGQKIAFKLLELTESYSPEVSEYKEAKIINFDPTTKQIELELLTASQAPSGPGKFDLVYLNPDGSERVESVLSRSSRVTELWETLLEPRLII